MNIDLISFQKKAVRNLRIEIAEALGSYHRTKTPQVVSLQAPTGAGKTIIMAALIESVYAGYTSSDGLVYSEQPEAIFVWLSDSPELNEQSKDKIELKTSKLNYGQCVTISEESFDKEFLEDGRIYFLNTQKISRAGNLTKHSDVRQHTIWETFENTIREKSDRLYFIIDEAHRGAKSKTEAGKDTTIMQRFIKGFDYWEDGTKRHMSPMPVVVGMSATAQRFNTLIKDATSSTLHQCVTTPDEVRFSGLLKDRIVITYPDDANKNNEMVLLEAATSEWVMKCRRWAQYCTEQKSARVDPVFVIQVTAGKDNALSETNLDDVVAKIEEKTGKRFAEGEVVHCFGSEATIEMNGLKVPRVNASDIADDHRIQVVLFKEALSTGWDCPRAETMMSFRHATDATYIAQLLGRMVRTPLQSRVLRDDFLNDVKLYLPHFNKTTVKSVVEELQNTEGGEIPTEINGESLAEPTYVNWTSRRPITKRAPTTDPNQINLADLYPMAAGPAMIFDAQNQETESAEGQESFSGHENQARNRGTKYPSGPILPPTMLVDAPASFQPAEGKQLELMVEISRESIIKYINEKGYLTYYVRQEKINDYLKSLLNLTTLLTYENIRPCAIDEVKKDITSQIRDYIQKLHTNGRYELLAQKVLQFKLSVQVFDAFGEALKNVAFADLLFTSETDLDRQLRNADAVLGSFGITNFYGREYMDPEDPNGYKIDCILFAADDACTTELVDYAKKKFHKLADQHRLAIANSKSDSVRKKYHDILADSDIVSEQLFVLPEEPKGTDDTDGKEYENHLYVDEKTGSAKIKLNGWEADLIEEESKRSDFVCWLRNPSRAAWALCLPYEMGGEKKRFYPDFLVVRSDPTFEYVVDILEPHGDQYADNLPKAKALAEYAKKEDRMGRIQLIRKMGTAADKSPFRRLDLNDLAVRDRVLRANTDDELKNIFSNYGKTE